MRVALVCPYAFDYPGGVQNHVLGLAGWLRSHGHEAFVLGPGRLDPEVARRNGLSEADFTSAGGWLPVPFNGSVARIGFGPLTPFRVRRWLEEIAPEVVHVHEPVTPSAALLALGSARVPVVATFHAVTRGLGPTRLIGRMVKGHVERIAASIAVSGSAAERAKGALGLDPVVIPNGIRAADFAGNSDGWPWRGGDRPVVSTLARLNERRKGVPVLLRAAPAILESPQAPRIVAAGPGRPPWRGRGVEFPGPVNEDGRAGLLRATDVFVAPQTGLESFGLVIVEALAAGAAVVASDLPEFAAVLAGSRPGVARLFAAGDAAALAAAVLGSLDARPDPAAARSFAARYDWDRVAPKILKVYESVRSASPRP